MLKQAAEVLFVCVVVMGVFSSQAISAGGGGYEIPIFESSGHVDLGNHGWASWNERQHNDNAQINSWANSKHQLVAMSIGLYVDQFHPEKVSFDAGVRFDLDLPPTGRLDRSMASGNERTNAWMRVYDQWEQVWAGYFDEKGNPVYVDELHSRMDYGLWAKSEINWISGNYYENIDVYGRNTGSYSFYASGILMPDGAMTGADIGRELVASGLAVYSVPEPSTAGLLVFGAIGLIRRRQKG